MIWTAFSFTFRGIMVVFHGYLAWRMWRMYREVIPWVRRMDAADPQPIPGAGMDRNLMEDVRKNRLAMHDRMHPFSALAGAMQLFGILMALVAPSLSSLTGFVAWGAPAMATLINYWVHVERAKRIEEDEQRRDRIVDLLVEGPLPEATLAREPLNLGTQWTWRSYLDHLSDQGLVERVNLGTPYEFEWRLTESGDAYSRLRGVRERITT